MGVLPPECVNAPLLVPPDEVGTHLTFKNFRTPIIMDYAFIFLIFI
jgi:hypothetical protein